MRKTLKKLHFERQMWMIVRWTIAALLAISLFYAVKANAQVVTRARGSGGGGGGFVDGGAGGVASPGAVTAGASLTTGAAITMPPNTFINTTDAGAGGFGFSQGASAWVVQSPSTTLGMGSYWPTYFGAVPDVAGNYPLAWMGPIVNGSYTYTPTIQPGKFGTGAAYNGGGGGLATTSYNYTGWAGTVAGNDPGLPGLFTTRTLEWWMMENTSGTTGYIMGTTNNTYPSYNEITNNGMFLLTVGANALDMVTYWPGCSCVVHTTTPAIVPADSAFHHYALTLSTTTSWSTRDIAIYVDGVATYSSIGGGALKNPSFLGASTYYTSIAYGGGTGGQLFIDDMRLSRTVVSPSEILYDATSGQPHRLTADTIGLWRFDADLMRNVLAVNTQDGGTSIWVSLFVGANTAIDGGLLISGSLREQGSPFLVDAGCSTVGEGAINYDTTIHRPVYCNGVSWGQFQ